MVHAEFVHFPLQQTWAGWTIDLLVKKPAGWILNKVKDSVFKTQEAADDTGYVHVAACMVSGIIRILTSLMMYFSVWHSQKVSDLYLYTGLHVAEDTAYVHVISCMVGGISEL